MSESDQLVIQPKGKGLAHFSIAQRQGVVHGVFLFLVVAQLIFVLNLFQAFIFEIDASREVRRPLQRLDTHILQLATALPGNLRRALGGRNSEELQQFLEDYQRDLRQLEAIIETASLLAGKDFKSVDPVEEQRQYSDLRAKHTDLSRIFEKVLALHSAGNTTAADDLLRISGDPASIALIAAAESHDEYFFLHQTAVLENARTRLVLTRTVLIAAGLGAVFLAVFFAWLVARSIRQPLNRVIQTMERIAGGDATAQVQVDDPHEIGRLQQAAVKMIQILKDDIALREQFQVDMMVRFEEARALNERLTQTQTQLLQNEKLASIGQLAAGVAHEINNPIGFIQSNMGSLGKYMENLFALIARYESGQRSLLALLEKETLTSNFQGAVATEFKAVDALRSSMDLDFLKEDIPTLISESNEGIARVKKIVQDLRDFSRSDATPDWKLADLHAGLDSTINIVQSEIKYAAQLHKQYGLLPAVECLPEQLNQVFMNLLVNAAQAMPNGKLGNIYVRTGVLEQSAWIEIADDGAGMSPEVLARIFDPFFTTKPVGKGTGLGLSLSHGIVNKHGGKINVTSEMGQGTTFRVSIPLSHDAGEETETTQ